MDPIKKAAKAVGSQRRLAEMLGVTPGAISQWLGGNVPVERCVDIEKATAGKVSCEELRPDHADRWAYLRGANREQKAA
jgi:DNA-binding transcriptional regulator YdaS (Cro superfamily)